MKILLLSALIIAATSADVQPVRVPAAKRPEVASPQEIHSIPQEFVKVAPLHQAEPTADKVRVADSPKAAETVGVAESIPATPIDRPETVPSIPLSRPESIAAIPINRPESVPSIPMIPYPKDVLRANLGAQVGPGREMADKVRVVSMLDPRQSDTVKIAEPSSIPATPLDRPESIPSIALNPPQNYPGYRQPAKVYNNPLLR